MSENGIAYTEYDIDADEDAKARLAEINPRTSIPTFRIDDIVQIACAVVRCARDADLGRVIPDDEVKAWNTS